MSTQSPAQLPLDKVIDYIQLTGAIMEKTAALAVEKEAQDKMISSLIPQAVEALIKNERIEPQQKEAAVKVLSNPVTALEVLIKTAQHRNDSERNKIGEPVKSGSTKSASYSSSSDGYVGRRSTPAEKESDRVFKQRLGLA